MKPEEFPREMSCKYANVVTGVLKNSHKLLCDFEISI